MSLAERVRDLREGAGLTQTALARPRYSVSYVSQIESGKRKPSAEALSFFAAKLGVTSGFLGTGVPDDLEESLRYQLEEGRRAIRTMQGQEAERILRPILGQAEQYGLAGLRAQALAVLGDAVLHQGRLREAIDVYEEALQGGALPHHDAGMAVSGLARAYRGLGDLTYATEVVESFLRDGEPGPVDAGVVAELQAVLVSIYFERGDVLRAERAAKRALAAADQDTPPEVRANACWDASRIMAEAKRWDEALDLATRARVLMEELENRRSVARLHNAYAFICLEAEPPRTQDAAHNLDRAEKLLKEGAAAPGDLAFVYTERARLAVLESRFVEAVAHADRALQDVNDVLEVARCHFLKGRALGQLGRIEEADDALRRAATLFGNRGARQQEASCWRELGELYLTAGDVDSAVQALRSGLDALDPRRSRA